MTRLHRADICNIRAHERFLAAEGSCVRFREPGGNTVTGQLIDVSEMGIRFRVEVEDPEAAGDNCDSLEDENTIFELIPHSSSNYPWTRIPGRFVQETRQWSSRTYRVRLAEAVQPDLLALLSTGHR